MSKKRADRAAKGASALLQGGFGNSQVEEKSVESVSDNKLKMPLPPTPAIPTMITLPVEHIQYFEGNPRLGKNPKYDLIKESIKSVGVTQVVQVTKRPNDDFYVISAGGNTRLSIVKELYQEALDSNDEELLNRFSTLDVKFTPYTDEITLVSQHYQENDLKAVSSFIDNSIAYSKAVLLIEEDRKALMGESYKPFSNQQMVDHLSSDQVGMKVRRQLLPVYLFAVEVMDYFPLAFQAGMGRHAVEKIREAQNRFTAWIEAKGLSDLKDELLKSYYAEVTKNDKDDLFNHDEVVAFCEEAMATVALTLGEEDIATELENLKQYQSLEAPKEVAPVEAEEVAPVSQELPVADTEVVIAETVEIAPVDKADDIAPVGVVESVAEVEANTNPIVDVVADSVTEELPVAKEIVQDVAPDFSIEEDIEAPVSKVEAVQENVVETVAVPAQDDVEAERLLAQSIYDAVESNVLLNSCFKIVADGSGQKGLVKIYKDLYFNAVDAVDLSNSGILDEVEFGQLVLGYSVLGDLILYALENSNNDDDQTKRNKNAAFIWYINRLSTEMDVSVISVSNLLSRGSVSSEKSASLNAIYINLFVEMGMDSIDFQEFVSEYFSLKGLVHSLSDR